MKLRALLVSAVMGVALVAVGCTAEVEDEGRAPDIDVSADPGEVPDIDVDPARVDIGTDTQQVVTPDIDVTPTEGDDPDRDTATP